MRKCPKCNTSSTEFRLTAFTVESQMVVRFSGSEIETIGPAVASSVIKPGKEINSPNARLTCLTCGHSGGIKTFKIVNVSYLTGKEADYKLRILDDLDVWVHASELDLADRVFDASNITWIHSQESIDNAISRHRYFKSFIDLSA